MSLLFENIELTQEKEGAKPHIFLKVNQLRDPEEEGPKKRETNLRNASLEELTSHVVNCMITTVKKDIKKLSAQR